MYGAFSVALKVLFVLPKLFLFYYVECSDLIMSFAKERLSAVKSSKNRLYFVVLYYGMRNLIIKGFIFFLCVLFQTRVFSQEIITPAILAVDSVNCPAPIFKDSLFLKIPQSRQNIFHHEFTKVGFVPGLFFTAAAATWGERKSIRRIRNRYVPGFRNRFDDYIQYAPAVATYALNISGVKGRNNLPRAFFSHAASLSIMAILVNTMKYTFMVERPDGSACNSFPSGHTAMAFTNATFMHKEYGPVNPRYSILGYSGAMFTALGRSLNNRHWVSDLLGGAGIGILSTQLGYFFIDKIYKNKGDNLGLLSKFKGNGNPSFLSVKLGNATPMHNMVGFLKDETSRSRLGFEGGLEGAWFFNKRWGVGAEVSFTSFSINPSLPFLLDDDDPSLGNAKLLMESIGTMNVSVGPQFGYTFSDKWLFMAKAQLGLAFGAKGKVSFELIPPDPVLGKIVDIIEYTPHTAWRGSLGTSITYKVNSELGFTFYTNYNYSKPTIGFHIDELFINPEDDFPSYFEESQPFDSLGIGLALTAFF